MHKFFLLAAGFILLAAGAIGMIVPVLPTTPFVILSAACFSAGNPQIYRWLCNTRYFGPFIKNYRSKTGVPIKVKRSALIFLWSMLLLSMLLTHKLPIVLLLTVIGIGVTVHILMLKTDK